MADTTQPTKARVKKFSIAGYDMLAQVNMISVWESIFKEHRTAQVKIIDTGNMINNLNLVGGMPASFSFDGFEDVSYDATMKLHSIKGEESNQSGRAKVYILDLVDEEYFNNKKQIVQTAFQGITGTQAIAKLHAQFVNPNSPLRILAESMGPVSLQAHIVRSKRPYTAIQEIMKKLNFAQFASNPLYFKDKDGHVLAPLEGLFSQLSPLQTLIEDTSLGKYWYEIFTSRNVIMQATAQIDISQNGRSGAADVASNKYQQKMVFDHQTKTKIVEQGVRQIAGGLLNGVSGALSQAFLDFSSLAGGQPNFWFMDGAHLPVATDQSAGAEQSRLYAALVKNGPGMTIRCPIQSGLNLTVGKGVFLRLQPPIGDYEQQGYDATSGTFLITDLMHQVFTDMRKVQATTQFQCVRGGTNA